MDNARELRIRLLLLQAEAERVHLHAAWQQVRAPWAPVRSLAALWGRASAGRSAFGLVRALLRALRTHPLPAAAGLASARWLWRRPLIAAAMLAAVLAAAWLLRPGPRGQAPTSAAQTTADQPAP